MGERRERTDFAEIAQSGAQVRRFGFIEDLRGEFVGIARGFGEQIGQALGRAFDEGEEHVSAILRRAETRGGAALADFERARAHLAHGDKFALCEDEGDGAGHERAVIAAAEQGCGEMQRVALFVIAGGFLERGALCRRRHGDAERFLDVRLFGVGRRFKVVPEGGRSLASDLRAAASENAEHGGALALFAPTLHPVFTRSCASCRGP